MVGEGARSCLQQPLRFPRCAPLGLPFLEARRRLLAIELADDLECHRRTVYRDLDALMFAGFPVLSERRDGKVFYRFVEQFELGDVPFTPDEILSLAFGEDLLRTLEGLKLEYPPAKEELAGLKIE